MPIEPWMKYKAKRSLGSIGMAGYYLQVERRRVERLHSVKSVISSQQFNKLHTATERYMRLRHNLSKAYLADYEYSDDGNFDDTLGGGEGGVGGPSQDTTTTIPGPSQCLSDIPLPPGGKDSYTAEDFFAPLYEQPSNGQQQQMPLAQEVIRKKAARRHKHPPPQTLARHRLLVDDRPYAVALMDEIDSSNDRKAHGYYGQALLAPLGATGCKPRHGTNKASGIMPHFASPPRARRKIGRKKGMGEETLGASSVLDDSILANGSYDMMTVREAMAQINKYNQIQGDNGQQPPSLHGNTLTSTGEDHEHEGDIYRSPNGQRRRRKNVPLQQKIMESGYEANDDAKPHHHRKRRAPGMMGAAPGGGGGGEKRGSVASLPSVVDHTTMAHVGNEALCRRCVDANCHTFSCEGSPGEAVVVEPQGGGNGKKKKKKSPKKKKSVDGGEVVEGQGSDEEKHYDADPEVTQSNSHPSNTKETRRSSWKSKGNLVASTSSLSSTDTSPKDRRKSEPRPHRSTPALNAKRQSSNSSVNPEQPSPQLHHRSSSQDSITEAVEVGDGRLEKGYEGRIYMAGPQGGFTTTEQVYQEGKDLPPASPPPEADDASEAGYGEEGFDEETVSPTPEGGAHKRLT